MTIGEVPEIEVTPELVRTPAVFVRPVPVREVKRDALSQKSEEM